MDAILAAIEAAADAAAKRREAQQQQGAPQPPPPRTVQPIARKPAPPAPRPAGPSAEPPLGELPGIPVAVPHRTGGLSGLFEDGNSLIRAIVAAEVLGPPIALRRANSELGEQSHWSQRPNEP